MSDLLFIDNIFILRYNGYMYLASSSAHSDDKENDVALRLWSFLYRSILHGSADDVCEVGGTTQPCSADCMFVGIQQALCK